MIPEGYEKLPEGVRCRCANLYREWNGNYWCCKGKQVAAATSGTLIETNLVVCLSMLREACSPYVPSTGRDNEWLARRDRVVANADAALAAISQADRGQL